MSVTQNASPATITPTQLAAPSTAPATAPIGPSDEVKADIAAKLKNIPALLYTVADATFGFRTVETDKIGADGKKIKEKRPNVTLALPFPTLEGIITAISDDTDPKQTEKVQQWLVGLVSSEILLAARTQVSDDEAPVNSQDALDLSKLTISFLANQPKSERTGGGISKETWEAFGKDYTSVMLSEGVDPKKIAKAVEWLLKKFYQVKTHKEVIGKLVQFLDIWFVKSGNQEDFKDCYEFLKNKAEVLLKADEASLVEQL